MFKVQGFSRVVNALGQPPLLFVTRGDRCPEPSGPRSYRGFRCEAVFDDPDTYLDTLDRIARLSGVEPVGGHRPYLLGAQSRDLLLFSESLASVNSGWAYKVYRQMLDGLDAFRSGVGLAGLSSQCDEVFSYERLLGVYKIAADAGVVTFSRTVDPSR